MCRGVPTTFSALLTLFLLSCATAPSGGHETNFFETARVELTLGQIFLIFGENFFATFLAFFFKFHQEFFLSISILSNFLTIKLINSKIFELHFLILFLIEKIRILKLRTDKSVFYFSGENFVQPPHQCLGLGSTDSSAN